MKNYATILLFAGGLALAGCSGSGDSAPAAGAMNAKDIQDNFVGSTYQSSADAKGAYNKDGTATFESAKEKDTGTWRLDGDSFCVTWKKLNNAKEQCFTLKRLDDGKIEVSNGSVLTKV